MIEVNENSEWAKRPMFLKRINGFISYSFMAISALFVPVETDMAVYDVLKKQFIDK